MGLISDIVFVAMLTVVSVTDLRRRAIPNRVLAVAGALGLVLIGTVDPGSLPGHLVAALAAGGAFLLIVLIRPGSFGMGDVKLVAAMGLFLGGAVLGAVLVALLGGSCLGLALVGRHGAGARKRTIPFGPFLALGGLAALVGAVPWLQ